MMTATTTTYEVDFDGGATALYKCITEEDWPEAMSAVEKSPREARTWVVRRDPDSGSISWKFLPLHSACARRPPLDVVTALLDAFPEAAEKVDDQGM